MEVEAEELVLVEGEKMHLKLPYRAIPKPTMVWKKDETELKTDDRMTLTCEMKSVYLELVPKVVHADAGVYTVKLENPLGSITGTVKVKVIGKLMTSEHSKFKCIIVGGDEKSHSMICTNAQACPDSARTLIPVKSPRTPARSHGSLQRMTVALPSSTTSWREERHQRRHSCL